jgi:hypothetical protein
MQGTLRKSGTQKFRKLKVKTEKEDVSELKVLPQKSYICKLKN